MTTTIRFQVLQGNLFGTTAGLDVDASAEKYVELATAAVRAAYPEAEVVCDYQPHTSGASRGVSASDDAPSARDIEDNVEAILERVFEADEWYVDEEPEAEEIDPADYTLYDADTNDLVNAIPAEDMIRASLAAGDTGIVAARPDATGEYHPVREDEATTEDRRVYVRRDDAPETPAPVARVIDLAKRKGEVRFASRAAWLADEDDEATRDAIADCLATAGVDADAEWGEEATQAADGSAIVSFRW